MFSKTAAARLAFYPQQHARTFQTRRAFTSTSRATMKIVPVPVRSDNYAYLLHDDKTKEAIVVDPFDVKKVVEKASQEGLQLGQHLLTTHHHHDHSGGNNAFAQEFPSVKIYGGSDRCQGMNHKVSDGDKFEIGDLHISCLATPCHTQDSICYFVQDKSTGQKAVFTGDTLFVAGCGRFFEGSATEMNKALNTVLAALPDDTLVYCGHEYTKGNVKFAKAVDPDNPAVQALEKFVDAETVTTGRFTIGDEKQHNPFMRLDTSAVQKSTGSRVADEVMHALREMKNAS